MLDHPVELNISSGLMSWPTLTRMNAGKNNEEIRILKSIIFEIVGPIKSPLWAWWSERFNMRPWNQEDNLVPWSKKISCFPLEILSWKQLWINNFTIMEILFPSIWVSKTIRIRWWRKSRHMSCSELMWLCLLGDIVKPEWQVHSPFLLFAHLVP